MKKFVAGIGHSDFQQFREAGYGYVDKTKFVCDVLEDPSLVLLFPRPRRFGKTINLSMLGHFLRKTNGRQKNGRPPAHGFEYVLFASHARPTDDVKSIAR